MNQIIAITCHDYSDYTKVTGSVDVELTVDGKLSVFALEKKFNLKLVKKIVAVNNGVEKCVLIPFDATSGYSDASFFGVSLLKITGEAKGSTNLVLGQVLSVAINQSKLMKKYLTPNPNPNISCPNPADSSTPIVDLSTLGLELESTMFTKSTTPTPCIVIDVQRDYDWTVIGAPPPITIVLISGFDAKPLCQVMAEEEFKRVIPIYPTSAHPQTASPLHTTPEWLPHPNRKVPSYVLCIPIKVYPQNLCKFNDDSVDDNLEKLKLHIIFLGGVIANADFEDLEEVDSDSDSDDDVELKSGEMSRIVRWDEIVV